MNGRVYDPLTAMFFSPDPYVQAPGNWLNYNRYGYCYGNPFRYTDPSGKVILTILSAIFCPALLPFAIAADLGGIMNIAAHSSSMTGANWFQNALVAYGIGAVGGALAVATGGAALTAGAGIGVALGAAGMSYTASTLVTSAGNTVYFHDPMPTQNQYLKGLAFSLITAGAMYEVANPPVIRDTRPIPNPIKTPTVGIKPSDVNVASNLSDDISNNVSNGISGEINSTEEALPMQSKVMTTVKGPDGQLTYEFKDVSTDIRPTVDRIASGESLPYRNDGSVFMNKEGLLPQQDEGYYKEFVHPTPNIQGPGAMRIVTGQGGEMWFTFDHYRTFIPIQQ